MGVLPAAPASTVVITTRNRLEDLRRALASVVIQTARPEIVVLDDGSDDGTSAMVSAEYPGVRLIRFEQSRGYIVGRNHAASIAVGEIIFSLDDDAVYSSPTTIEQALPAFDDPRVGAIALPYVDVHYGPETKQLAPDGPGNFVIREFRGTAHALRRALFLEAGGYRVELFRQCEEADLCLRLLDRGFVTEVIQAPAILHYESPRRNSRQIHIYGRRNDLLVAWWNYPADGLAAGIGNAILNGLRTGRKTGYLGAELTGMIRGLGAMLRFFSLRHPVNRNAFALWRKLAGGRALPGRRRWKSWANAPLGIKAHGGALDYIAMDEPC